MGKEKKYWFRLVNAAMDTHFGFIVNKQNMAVIASDFVSFVPYKTDILSIKIGQKYAIVVKADQVWLNY